MAPTDADEHLILSFGAKTKFAHGGGMHVLLADGSLRFVSANLPVADRLALISISGKEKPPEY
jgi:prepilin-type processing-associated H-X9-DG protein